MRLTLTRRFPHVYACWIGEFDDARAASADAVLIKLHAVDEGLTSKADAIFTCHRDLRDVAASMLSMGWVADFDSLLQHLRHYRGLHEYWSAHANIDLSYRDIMVNPVCSLKSVATQLKVQLAAHEIAGVAAQLDAIPNNRDQNSIHDHEFLTHQNHRNDGRDGRWRDQLDEDLAIRIAEEHRNWLLELGYEIDSYDALTVMQSRLRSHAHLG